VRLYKDTLLGGIKISDLVIVCPIFSLINKNQTECIGEECAWAVKEIYPVKDTIEEVKIGTSTLKFPVRTMNERIRCSIKVKGAQRGD